MQRTLLASICSLLLLPLFAVQVSVSVQHARCGNDNGRVTAQASGGIPPYSYTWNTGGTGSQLSGLAAGSYTVTVTDGLGETAIATAEVQQIFQLAPVYGTEIRSDCDHTCSGWIEVGTWVLGGTSPYTFSHNEQAVFQNGIDHYTLYGVCAYNPPPITITDSNGCAGTVDFEVSNAPLLPVGILSTTPACGSDGTATLSGGWEVRVIGLNFDSVYVLDEGPILTGLPAGTYWLEAWNSYAEPMPAMQYCTMGAELIIESLPEPCGSISGRIFHDVDQDCQMDPGDIALPYRVITIGPDQGYIISNGNGEFFRAMGQGSYTLEQTLVDEVQVCPPAQPISFTLDAATPHVMIDIANHSTLPHDVGMLMSATPARPGFATKLYVNVRNNSPFPSGELQVSINVDPVLLNVTQTQWTIPVLGAWQNVVHVIHAMVPADITLLGTILQYHGNVTNTMAEDDLGNNVAATTREITGSYDPNDKVGITNGSSSPEHYFLQGDEWIDYTIRFQNTGNDTAFTVVIRDTISDLLHFPSLDILASSHEFTPSFAEGRTLVFTFNNILLPDSTTDLEASEGFVSFRIKPVNSLMVGDVIENTAGIYFDFNPPIITNTTAHVVTTSTAVHDPHSGKLLLMPNPATDQLMVVSPGMVRPQVLSLDGRVVNVPMDRSGTGYSLDVSSMSPGAYLVRIQDEQGIRTGRFVKQ